MTRQASEIPKHERELLVWFIARLSLAAKVSYLASRKSW